MFDFIYQSRPFPEFANFKIVHLNYLLKVLCGIQFSVIIKPSGTDYLRVHVGRPAR